MPHIVLLGTCDTKVEELLYLRSLILSFPSTTPTTVTLIDCGRTSVSHPSITIPQSSVLKHAPSSSSLTTSGFHALSRGDMISHIITCTTSLVLSLLSNSSNPIHGIISAGGSGGTSLASAAMRTLPIGFPKLIVSTVASGDTGPIVAETDITLMYSVVDIAGRNHVLDAIFENAAAAIVGMAGAYELRQTKTQKQSQAQTANPSSPSKDPATAPNKRTIRVGMTMFGVTTPCIDSARSYLASLSSSPTHPYSYTPYVFHATGHGGLAMERLLHSGDLDAVLDLTTTEVADHIVGGVMSAGPERLRAAAELGKPCVVSLGACDMVNFGSMDSVPEKFRGGPGGNVEKGEGKRNFVEHNPTVTLMRTTPEECTSIGSFIASQLRQHATRPGLISVLMPESGVSMLSESGSGGVFEDVEADRVLFDAVEEGLKGSGIEVVRDGRAINEEGFARGAVDRLVELIGRAEGKELEKGYKR